MNKCCASQDGICRNYILFGAKCDGYKERCTLRPCYENLEKVANGTCGIDTWKRVIEHMKANTK